ncbi:MAG: 4-hydroxythreonine-4-phosphate dehydrogenase [Candidatus Binatia bacterium]|nr:MAG: 4-hydroxythreonine-4-phosphate dehydrogenase [Candidatus Binatia bacterium]
MNLPRIAVTMGDPSGVGPEVALRALARPEVRRSLVPVLFGDPAVFEETSRRLGLGVAFRLSEDGHPFSGRAMALRPCSELPASARRPGRPTAAGGEASYRAILAAVEEVLAGRFDALVTGPVSKRWICEAGHRFSGHTELLAELSGASDVRMMLVGSTLRVVLVTTHVAFRDVPGAIDSGKVERTVALAHGALRTLFGLRRPRLALCGLNPHAGEGGLWGDEEARLLDPAVRRLRRRRVGVEGPLPADAAFALHRKYDAIVCLYHDQGLAPFKLVHFEDGVNLTLGLPFVRTSPDHGTAFDLAGRGTASSRSMEEAVLLAARLSRRRRARRR